MFRGIRRQAGSIESAHSEQGRERGKRPIHPIFGKPDDFPGRRVHLLCRTAPERGAKEALRAQGSIEWVVIVVCIAVALIAALVFLSGEMNNKINTVANTLKNTTVNGAHAGN